MGGFFLFGFLPWDGAAPLNVGAHTDGQLAEFLSLIFGKVPFFQGVIVQIE